MLCVCGRGALPNNHRGTQPPAGGKHRRTWKDSRCSQPPWWQYRLAAPAPRRNHSASKRVSSMRAALNSAGQPCCAGVWAWLRQAAAIESVSGSLRAAWQQSLEMQRCSGPGDQPAASHPGGLACGGDVGPRGARRRVHRRLDALLPAGAKEGRVVTTGGRITSGCMGGAGRVKAAVGPSAWRAEQTWLLARKHTLRACCTAGWAPSSPVPLAGACRCKTCLQGRVRVRVQAGGDCGDTEKAKEAHAKSSSLQRKVLVPTLHTLPISLPPLHGRRPTSAGNALQASIQPPPTLNVEVGRGLAQRQRQLAQQAAPRILLLGISVRSVHAG